MADAPCLPWVLSCPWCDFKITVFARGMRGPDPGSGVEAAYLMKSHLKREHEERTWQEFLAA